MNTEPGNPGLQITMYALKQTRGTPEVPPNNPPKEDIIEWLENTPEAFIGLLQGGNFGKPLVRLARYSTRYLVVSFLY